MNTTQLDPATKICSSMNSLEISSQWPNIPEASLLNRIQSVVNQELPHKCRSGLKKHPLGFSIAKGNSRTFDVLLSKDCNLNEFNGEPLFEAIYHSRIEMLRKLLAHGADDTLLNRSGNTPLMLAEFLRNKEAVRAILDNLIDKGMDLEEGISVAAENGCLFVLQSLFDLKGKENIDIPAVLDIALMHNHPNLVRYLLSCTKIKKEDLDGWILERGLTCCSSEILEVLLEEGANIRRALKLATQDGCLLSLEFLARKTDFLNFACDEDGNTLLHLSVASQIPEAFSILRSAGADVNIPNFSGISAWEAAEKSGSDFLKALQKLEPPKAAISLKDKDQLFPEEAIADTSLSKQELAHQKRKAAFQRSHQKEQELINAVNNPQIEPLASLLLEKSPFSDLSLGKAVIAAVEKHHSKHLMFLLNSGPVWEPLLYEAIKTAIRINNLPAVKQIIPFPRKEVNPFRDYGIVESAKSGNMEVLSFLLEETEELLPTRVKTSAWLEAISNGQINSVYTLMALIPGIEHIDCWNACQKAYDNGHKEFFQDFLELKIPLPLNLRKILAHRLAGETLMSAAEQGDIEKVAKLLRAEPKISKEYRKAAIEKARLHNHENIQLEIEDSILDE